MNLNFSKETTQMDRDKEINKISHNKILSKIIIHIKEIFKAIQTFPFKNKISNRNRKTIISQINHQF